MGATLADKADEALTLQPFTEWLREKAKLPGAFYMPGSVNNCALNEYLADHHKITVNSVGLNTVCFPDGSFSYIPQNINFIVWGIELYKNNVLSAGAVAPRYETYEAALGRAEGALKVA